MFKRMIFIQKYFKLINEWVTSGSQSLLNFPKSRILGLYKFNINSGHANNRDYERIISYSIGESCAYKILDEGCEIIFKNHIDKHLWAALIQPSVFKKLK